MKKLIYAAGVLSLGGVNLAVQAAEGGTKPWTVGLTAQGFYDDNINTAPDGPSKVGSWGLFVSPNVTYAQTWDQTTVNLGASYGAYYYTDTDGTLDDDWSQTASLNLDATHTFNPRITLEVTDDFALFQNANQLLMGQTGRINGNNISNDANIALSIELTSRFSVELGYENIIYDYEEDVYSAVLDRMENYGRLDLRYLLVPTTVAVVGTKIGNIDYNKDLGMSNPASPVTEFNPTSEIKDNRSYFIYGGFDHSFTPGFSGSLRAGAEVQEFTELDIDDEVNPYVDFSLKYAYRVNSSAQFGIIHRTNPSSLTGFLANNGENPVLEQVSTAVYVNVNHAITAKFSGKVTASWQSSEYVGGFYDGQNEQWWAVGATLSYSFTRNIAANISYYYDLLNSDVRIPTNPDYTQDYNRNRVFFGITATY